jgi:hypothetical protein
MLDTTEQSKSLQEWILNYANGFVLEIIKDPMENAYTHIFL